MTFEKLDTILDCHLGVEFPAYNVHLEMHDVASLVLSFCNNFYTVDPLLIDTSVMDGHLS